MQNYKWLYHQNTRVLYIALASQSKEELAAKIAEISPIIEKEPLGSLCCIADVKNGRFSPDIMKMLRDFTAHNVPYMKMTILIGIEGLQRTLYDSFIMVTRRKNMATKDTLEEALDYMAEISGK